MVERRKSPWEPPTQCEIKETQILIDLGRSVQQEEDAIFDYRERLKVAEAAGDLATVEVYKHVIPEEEEHLKEFTKRIREIGGSA